MTWLLFLIVALIMRKRMGAVIALCLAAFIDISTEYAYFKLGSSNPIDVFYVALFLLTFIWWIATSKLKLVSSQIVAGLCTAFSSTLVVDCYFSGGYETALSIADPYVFTLLNIATIWAAFNDRNWTYIASNNGRARCSKGHDKVGTRC